MSTVRTGARAGRAARKSGAPSLPLLEVKSRPAWRRWLAAHHASTPEIWLVFRKDAGSKVALTYDGAVEEALCYGWIDSLVRRLDDARYARKFTPRKPGSRWSTANRRRYADLKARGLLAAPGRRLAPTDRSGDAPRPSLDRLPKYFEQGLKQQPAAWRFFNGLAPSYRRAYVAWVDSAKRPETKARRLTEAVQLLAAGRKLGLK